MQHISEHLANASAKLTSGAGSDRERREPPGLAASRVRVARLWEIFADTFGEKWIRDAGESDAGDSWARILIDCSVEDIGRGIDGLKKRGAAWPPSAFEFWRMCRPQKREGAHLLQYGRSLPAPKVDEEKARLWLFKARAALARDVE